MAYHIKADGTVVAIIPKKGKTFDLAELQAYVGGYIEMLGRLDHDSIIRDPEKKLVLEVKPGDVMIIDEEGKLKKKPLNKIATLIYDFGKDQAIVGDVVLCNETEVR